jgi:hypothetical protein
MRIPGFTAEKSLYAPTHQYPTTRDASQVRRLDRMIDTHRSITPQARIRLGLACGPCRVAGLTFNTQLCCDFMCDPRRTPVCYQTNCREVTCGSLF